MQSTHHQVADWSQGAVHTCSPVLGSAAKRQSSSYVRLGERGSNSVLGSHRASISATKAIPFFSPLCEHWGQGLRLADIYKMPYCLPGCWRLLCGAWSLVGVDVQDLSQRSIHMPLPQGSLQINFLQGPDKPDMLRPLLRNPCIPLLFFPHEAKALCREDCHLPLISGPLLSEVSLGQESTPPPQVIKTTFREPGPDCFLHQLAMGSPIWGHRYRLGRRMDARVVSDRVWTTFCGTYLCPLDTLRLGAGYHFHFIIDCCCAQST